MATLYATAAMNINAATWSLTNNNTPDTRRSYTDGDTLIANSYAITVNVSSATANLSTATNGGSFAVSSAFALIGTVAAGTTPCVVASGSGYTLSVSSTVTGGGTAGAYGINTTTTTSVSGLVKGGSAATSYGINGDTGSTVTVVDIEGGSNASAYGIFLASTSTTVNFSGTVTGKTGHGIYNSATTTATINGTESSTVVGSTSAGISGIYNNTTGTVTVVNVTAGTGALSPGVYNKTTGTLTVTGTITNVANGNAITGKCNYAPGEVTNYIQYPYSGGTYEYGKTIPPGSVVSGVNGDGANAPATGTYVAAVSVIGDGGLIN